MATIILLHDVNVYSSSIVYMLVAPLTIGLALQSPPLVLQTNSTGHQLQFKEPTQQEQLKRWKIVGLRYMQ